MQSLSQYFCSCVFWIWKLGGMSLYHLVCSWTWVSADLPNVWVFYFASRDYLHFLPPSVFHQPNSWCNSADFRQATWAVKQVHFAFSKSCLMPACRQEGRQLLNVLHFIRVDFRLSVKCPQVIRSKRKNRKGAANWKAKSILGFFTEALEVGLVIIIVQLIEFCKLFGFFCSFNHYFF